MKPAPKVHLALPERQGFTKCGLVWIDWSRLLITTIDQKDVTCKKCLKG